MGRHGSIPLRLTTGAHDPVMDAIGKTARRQIDSTKLFQGARELEITHHGETYCLRVTRNEKLILTK